MLGKATACVSANRAPAILGEERSLVKLQLELWAKILEPKGYGTLSQTQVDIVHMQQN